MRDFSLPKFNFAEQIHGGSDNSAGPQFLENVKLLTQHRDI